MSNPNFVNDLVMMAKAFEELPKVQAALEHAQDNLDHYAEQVQRLELRLIDKANELEAAHAATRKAEVERDHAETMFLETDSKLDQAKSVLNALMGNAGDFLRAVEPPKPEPEPVVEPTPEPQGDSMPSSTYVPSPFSYDRDGPVRDERASDPTSATNSGGGTSPSEGSHYTEAEHGYPLSEPKAEDQRDAAPTVSSWASPASEPQPVNVASAVSDASAVSSTTGESAVDPTASTIETAQSAAVQSAETTDTVKPSTLADAPEVASPSDPIPATESSSESASPVSTESLPNELRPDPEPLLRYSPEWYQWADRVGYWNRKQAAQ